MRIIFMGTPDFAVPSLQALVEAGYDVVGVFTQPDKPKGRGKKMAPPPVKVYAEEHGIPVYQPVRIRKESVEDIKALHPDLCVTAAFGQILSQELLDIPKLGCINVHASLLPRHRGSAPINWAIVQGDEEAGVTTMMMAAGIDDGDMLLKKSTPIGETETAGELTVRLSRLGAELLMETMQQLEAGRLTRIPQEEQAMTYDPKLEKSMGVMDWAKPAKELAQLVQGLNPWPGCSTAWQGARLKILRAKAVDGQGTPGEILTADAQHGLVIACGQDALQVLELQAPGGKGMNAKDYLRGHSMVIGSVLKEEE